MDRNRMREIIRRESHRAVTEGYTEKCSMYCRPIRVLLGEVIQEVAHIDERTRNGALQTANEMLDAIKDKITRFHGQSRITIMATITYLVLNIVGHRVWQKDIAEMCHVTEQPIRYTVRKFLRIPNFSRRFNVDIEKMSRDSMKRRSKGKRKMVTCTVSSNELKARMASITELANLLKDEKRVGILLMLSTNSLTFTEMMRGLGVKSSEKLAYHIRVLKGSQLIENGEKYHLTGMGKRILTSNSIGTLATRLRHETRIDIMLLLSESELSPRQMMDELDATPPGELEDHIKVLRRSRLLVGGEKYDLTAEGRRILEVMDSLSAEDDEHSLGGE